MVKGCCGEGEGWGHEEEGGPEELEGCAAMRRKKGAEEVCGGCGREEGKGRSRGCGGIRSRGSYMATRWAFGPLGVA